MKNLKTIFFTIFAFSIIAIFITACCKNKVDSTKIKCALNMATNAKGDSCVCDSNSVWNGTKCVNIGAGTISVFQNLPHINSSTTSLCTDWRKNFAIGFEDINDVTTTSLYATGRYDNGVIGNLDLRIDKYKTGSLYDSVICLYGEIDFYSKAPTDTVGVFMRINKNRDTMWAEIRHASLIPYLIYTDTCLTMLTKIR